MREFTYETQGANTYLVYQINANDAVDSMSLGMLTNNNITGFAQTFIQQMDMTKYIKYNISSKVSVKQFFTGVVNRKRLLGVLSGIVNALIAAEEYMLDPDTVLLNLDYIYADVSSCETELICLPIECGNHAVDLGGFFKNIIFTTQFDQTENCDHVAKIINYLNSMSSFSLMDFKRILDELNQGVGAANVPMSSDNVGQLQQSGGSVMLQQPVTSQHPVSQQPVTSQQPVQQLVTPQQPMASTTLQQPEYLSAPQQQAAPVMPQQSVASSQSGYQPMPQPIMPGKGKGKAVKPPKAPKNKKAKSENLSQGNEMSFKVPGKSTGNAEPEVNAAAPDSEEKISWFYLMQHYNKENAAKYKAQKEAAKGAVKKSKKGSSSDTMGMPIPSPMNGGMVSNQPSKIPSGFAVPGQSPTTPITPAPAAQPMPNPTISNTNASAMPFGNHVTGVQPVQPAQSAPIASPVQPAVADRYAGIVTTTGNFGETVVLNAGKAGETTVLNGNMLQENAARRPYLVRKKNGERILLDKPVFRIGKERSYVDYFIGDNPAISRGHANIILRDGEYFVVDTNSTNHTYVNGEMIQSNAEVKIVPGTMIRFANEEFELQLN